MRARRRLRLAPGLRQGNGMLTIRRRQSGCSWGWTLEDHNVLQRLEMLRAALGHLQAALDLVDHASAPGQIGAHIDLAYNQLADMIAGSANDEPVGRIEQILRH